MTEWRLFPEGEEPFVSTAAFHSDRKRAPHLEQGVHRPRLDKAAELVADVVSRVAGRETVPAEVIDLGCGDGGLLSLIQGLPNVNAYGYDFQPSNAAGWAERGVDARVLNFVEKWSRVPPADVYILTEVLEHLADPHRMVWNVAQRGGLLVASSPWTEHAGSHDACHAWAWDMDGYRALMEQGGMRVLRHEQAGMFQVLLAEVAR